jgi:hypothetical protein
MALTKRPLLFSVIRDDTQGGYAHLSIRVHEPAYGGFNREELLEVTFQSDQDNPDWYAGSVAVQLRWGISPEPFARAARLLVRIGEVRAPQQLTDRLLALGVPRYVYDARLSKLVAVDAAMPPDYGRYYDDYHRSRNLSGASISVLARDEEEARLLATKEFADFVTRHHSGSERMERWLSAGRPMCFDHHSPAPCTSLLEKLLKPLGAKDPAVENEGAK